MIKLPAKFKNHGLEFLYEDRDLVVVNKPVGLLTNSLRGSSAVSAEAVVGDYLRKGNSRSRLCAWLVHRLDRETSGVMVFAKSEAVQQKLKDRWHENEKLYLAVVGGGKIAASGVYKSCLAEDDDYFVHSVPEGGKFACTEYRLLFESSKASAVMVRLLTGRKNQIRVHFSEAGHPVLGDRKYGPGARASRLMLHAKTISFFHPHSGARMTFDTEIPAEFFKAVPGFTAECWPQNG